MTELEMETDKLPKVRDGGECKQNGCDYMGESMRENFIMVMVME